MTFGLEPPGKTKSPSVEWEDRHPILMVDMWECQGLLGFLAQPPGYISLSITAFPSTPPHWSAPFLLSMTANAYEGDAYDAAGEGEPELP